MSAPEVPIVDSFDDEDEVTAVETPEALGVPGAKKRSGDQWAAPTPEQIAEATRAAGS